MVKTGTIDADDLHLFHVTDDPDDVVDRIRTHRARRRDLGLAAWPGSATSSRSVDDPGG